MMRTCGFIYLAVIATIIGLSYGATDYCRQQCPAGTSHTMCIYRNSRGPSANCGVVKAAGPTAEEKQQIVKEHNDFRQKVARGQERRGNPGPQPAAKNMQTMTWDDELATIAQKWADQCTFQHDKCRNVARYAVGQNLAIKSTTGNSFSPVVELIRMWEDEVASFNRNDVKSLPRNNFSKIGHYTQMVWADTNKVGCGSAKYNKDGWNSHYLVCNYGPTGNWIGEPLYQQ